MIARGPMTDNNSRSTAMGLRWLCDGEGGADDRGEDEGGDDDVSHGEKVCSGDGMT